MTGRVGGVQHRLVGQERGRPHGVGDGSGEGLDRSQRFDPGLDAPGVDGADHDHRLAALVNGNPRCRRGMAQDHDRGHLLGCRSGELPVAAKHRGPVIQPVDDEAGHGDRTERMGGEFEFSDNAEIAAPAPQAPHQLRVALVVDA
ncbi:Uncharacterised protein [Mycobacterium tuberculosis]|nr:Uncharacterised protein [Mycobacterium tuberculosis]